jgi:hypothetical protein
MFSLAAAEGKEKTIQLHCLPFRSRNYDLFEQGMQLFMHDQRFIELVLAQLKAACQTGSPGRLRSLASHKTAQSVA